MPWTVEVTEVFERWWDQLSEEERISVDGMIRVLETQGPALKEPYAHEVTGSSIHLRQLRVPHAERAICVLFIPDPAANTVLLLSGSTRGTADAICPPGEVEQAEITYNEYLRTKNKPH